MTAKMARKVQRGREIRTAATRAALILPPSRRLIPMAADSGMPSISAPMAMAVAEAPCLSPGSCGATLLVTSLAAKKKATAPGNSPGDDASKPPARRPRP